MKERDNRVRSDKAQTSALSGAPHTATRVVFQNPNIIPPFPCLRHFNAIFVKMWSVENMHQNYLRGCLQRQTSRPTLEIISYIFEDSLSLEWIPKGKVRGKTEGEGRNASAASADCGFSK